MKILGCALFLVCLAGPVLAGTFSGSGSMTGCGQVSTMTVTLSPDCAGNGQIGDTDTGSVTTGRSQDLFYFTTGTITSGGKANYGHFKVSANSGGNKFAIYRNDSGTWNLLASGSDTGTGATGERLFFTLNTQVCLTAGVAYAWGIVSNDTSWGSWSDTQAGMERRRASMTYATAPAATLDVAGSTLLIADGSHIGSVNNNASGY